MTVDLVAAALNLPSQVRGRKAGLWPHPKRTLEAIRLWNKHRVEVVTLAELATMSRLTIRARTRWGLVTTTNDRFPLRKVGNGIAWRKDRWRLIDRDVIHVDTPTHARGIKFPVALLENRDEPTVRLCVIAVHIPTRVAVAEALQPRTTPDSPRVVALRNKLNGVVLNYAESVVAHGIPVDISGDFNDGSHKVYESWKTAAQHQVDAALVKGAGIAYDDLGSVPLGRISDHPAMPLCRLRLRIPRQAEGLVALPRN